MVKTKKEKIKESILAVIDYAGISLSIRQITIRLKEMFGIRLSPQIVKRYLLELKKESKIR